jgi:hypothetical protein
MQDNETVYFWLRRSGETDWQLIESKTHVGSTPGTGVNIGFEWPTTCAQQGIWEYKFNVSDDWNYTYEVYGGSFTVEKRGVILAVQEGAGIVIPREGDYARNLTVLVTDQVSSQPSR